MITLKFQSGVLTKWEKLSIAYFMYKSFKKKLALRLFSKQKKKKSRWNKNSGKK